MKKPPPGLATTSSAMDANKARSDFQYLDRCQRTISCKAGNLRRFIRIVQPEIVSGILRFQQRQETAAPKDFAIQTHSRVVRAVT